MKTSSYTYNLPQERIAQYPPKVRGTTNLLVLDRNTKTIEHKKYSDILNYIKPGDIVVLNNTKVDKVRVFLENKRNKKTIQCIFLSKIFLGNEKKETWEALLGRVKDVQEGDILEGVAVGKRVKEGIFQVTAESGVVDKIIMEKGHIPLPPYMKREDIPDDLARYNTVFAKKIGSSASPTASLNLTEEIIQKIKNKGARVVEVELKVGWGTFAPIRSEEIEKHKIHQEEIKISKETAGEINKTIKNGGDVWAFGTTVTRTLESCAYKENNKYYVKEYSGPTSLYIYPGYEWKIVNHMITNFHAPQSSLIVLVCAFANYDLIMKVYNEAIKKKYNFLSYGDSMLIL